MSGPSAPPPATEGGGAHAATPHGRAGRNLPAALAVGLGLGAYVVLTLVFWRFGFVLLIALALALASVELGNALRRIGLYPAVVPIVVGSVAIAIGSYLAGRQSPVVFSTTSVLLAALALTVVACLVWRMRGGAEGFVRDTAASMLIIAYVPLLGSFAALILAAPEDGVARMILFLLVVVMNDTGGYVAGVLFGKHPMAPRISPKKSWEGFAGSLVFGVVAAVLMAVYGLQAPVWVGVLLGVCLVAAGTCGDLVESLIKRDLGIKDMSSFLPGHGGVMDRLDSLLLAAPVAWVIMYVLVPGG
ncbi:phosphatidate cytidylyltransferase [Friedmanniella luteola]|uniref:Phosphatidate cytidylyltransferase n=1 Tax=Friedmanniella luteola TaxID=546871 RepID=A0A1H1PW36_9ACTN|nr:phosphatidate cytidylyltransferase [Friedmanniella luteola]SDS15571.1 phosphatidate cytidylyltransferase [Friedmanniella luteola]